MKCREGLWNIEGDDNGTEGGIMKYGGIIDYREG